MSSENEECKILVEQLTSHQKQIDEIALKFSAVQNVNECAGLLAEKQKILDSMLPIFDEVWAGLLQTAKTHFQNTFASIPSERFGQWKNAQKMPSLDVHKQIRIKF